MTVSEDQVLAYRQHQQLMRRRTVAALLATLFVGGLGASAGVLAVRSVPRGRWERKIVHVPLGDTASQAALDADLAAGWEIERRVGRRSLRTAGITYYLRRQPQTNHEQ